MKNAIQSRLGFTTEVLYRSGFSLTVVKEQAPVLQLAALICQIRSKLRGLVARIGVVVITSRARDAQIGRIWEIVGRASNKNRKSFVSCFCA